MSFFDTLKTYVWDYSPIGMVYNTFSGQTEESFNAPQIIPQETSTTGSLSSGLSSFSTTASLVSIAVIGLIAYKVLK